MQSPLWVYFFSQIVYHVNTLKLYVFVNLLAVCLTHTQSVCLFIFLSRTLLLVCVFLSLLLSYTQSVLFVFLPFSFCLSLSFPLSFCLYLCLVVFVFILFCKNFLHLSLQSQRPQGCFSKLPWYLVTLCLLKPSL